MSGSTWIVVVNYGSHALIEQNFAAHVPGSGTLGGVVLVDNFSSQQEQAAAARLCGRHGWTFVPRETNEGFAAGCNAGVRAAVEGGAVSVLLVNPDAHVSTKVVHALGQQLDGEPMTLVSPLVTTSAGTPYFRGSRVDLRNGHMRAHSWPDGPGVPEYLDSGWPYRDWLTGACLGFSTQLWSMVGGLDERYFLYWEDVDFSQRCVRAGGRLCLRRDLVAVHDEGGTHGVQGSRARSPLYYYYNCRNRIVYATVHLAGPDLWRWVRSTPRESWQILLRGGRRQLLSSPRPLLATILGSLAGYRLAVVRVLRPPEPRQEV